MNQNYKSGHLDILTKPQRFHCENVKSAEVAQAAVPLQGPLLLKVAHGNRETGLRSTSMTRGIGLPGFRNALRKKRLAAAAHACQSAESRWSAQLSLPGSSRWWPSGMADSAYPNGIDPRAPGQAGTGQPKLARLIWLISHAAELPRRRNTSTAAPSTNARTVSP